MKMQKNRNWHVISTINVEKNKSMLKMLNRQFKFINRHFEIQQFF